MALYPRAPRLADGSIDFAKITKPCVLWPRPITASHYRN